MSRAETRLKVYRPRPGTPPQTELVAKFQTADKLVTFFRCFFNMFETFEKRFLIFPWKRHTFEYGGSSYFNGFVRLFVLRLARLPTKSQVVMTKWCKICTFGETCKIFLAGPRICFIAPWVFFMTCRAYLERSSK